jgi:hypothetical protein
MKKSTNKRVFRPIDSVERVEFACECEKGVYRYNPDIKRISTHNQIPHSCNACGHIAYFTIPYPALRYKGRVFVDWETIRGDVR